MKGGLRGDQQADYLHRYDHAVSLTDSNDIREELLPFDYGMMYGACKLQYFEGGMLFHMDLKARQDCRPQMDSNKALVKMHFCLKGEKHAGLDNPDKVFHTRRHQNNLHYIPATSGYYDLKAGQTGEFIDICLEETFFETVFTDYPLAFSGLKEAISAKHFFELSETPLFTSPKMEAVLLEILNCQKCYESKKLYFHNKLIELLLLQFEACRHHAFCIDSKCACKVQEDYERLELARSILIEQYEQPPSISQLARLTGMNEFKLKKGFKEVYKTTIYGYLRDYKLGMAKEMILTQQLSVSEICYQLGYESPAHFSRLFKSRFDISPSVLKKESTIKKAC